ncbi:pilus assembly protein PilM [Herbaspirillum sp. AP02]|uniref:pilus assembly protein PilM n=1 Tax=unclassified Herbaspirillum TaxID=2624150 RepID=UPI0015DB9C39|nr:MULTISPECIES: pilus assembly protein PilM [unclassified Herbaspirillum]MBG7620794.1 pilus assembly protein PilM [Herbaspirillum sp. AP02]NZD68257.1 pilus assembly protein PilM [Herbaspirillum sp. AP21]
MASSIFPSRRVSARLCAGLDIGPDRVQLALLRRCGQRPQLLRLDQRRSARPLCRDGQVVDFDALVLICRSLLDNPACQGAMLALALPAATLTGRRLVLPAASSEVQRLAQVRAEMAAHGASDEAQVLDYRVLGPQPASPADVQVLALAASTLAIEDRLALAEALSRPLATLAPEDLCLAAWLRDERRADQTAILRLDRGGNWLLHGTAPTHCLSPQAAARGPLPLLASVAPLLTPLPRRLLLSGDAPNLNVTARAFIKYAGIDAQLAPIPSPLMLSSAIAAQIPVDYQLALALAWEGMA